MTSSIHSRTTGLAFALASALTFAFGCGQHTSQTAVKMGVEALSCPADLITPWAERESKYVVRGCGRQISVDCASAAGSGCAVTRPLSVAPARQPGFVAFDDAGAVDKVISDNHTAILKCGSGATIEFSGQVLAGISEGLSPADACVANVLAGKLPELSRSLRGKLKKATYTVKAPATPSEPKRPEAPKPTPTVATAPEPKPAPTVSDETLAVEKAVRDALDTRAAAALACSGSDQLALEATYSEDGSLTLTLRGNATGSPEERCVQEALKGLSIDTQGQAGRVIHLVTKPAAPNPEP